MTIPHCPHSGDGWCLECVKALDDENLELHRRLANPQKIVAEWEEGKGARVEVKHWAVKLMAASLADSLGEAPNFVTGEITVNSEQGPLIFTVQRKYGKSPAQVLGELREALTEIKHTIDGANFGWDEVCQYVAEIANGALGGKDGSNARVHGSGSTDSDGLAVRQWQGMDGRPGREGEPDEGQQEDRVGASGEEQAGPSGTQAATPSVRKVSFDAILDRTIELFDINHDIATPELLDLIERLVTFIEQHEPAPHGDLAKLLGIDLNLVNLLLHGVKRFVQVERKIVTQGTDEKVINTLKRLKQRPVIMRMLSALV